MLWLYGICREDWKTRKDLEYLGITLSIRCTILWSAQRWKYKFNRTIFHFFPLSWMSETYPPSYVALLSSYPTGCVKRSWENIFTRKIWPNIPCCCCCSKQWKQVPKLMSVLKGNFPVPPPHIWQKKVIASLNLCT